MSPVFACPVKYLPNEIFIQLKATPIQSGRNEFLRGGLATLSKMDSTEEPAEPFFSLSLRRAPFNSINQTNQRINLESLSLQPLSFDHSFRLLLNATN
jgi:hypothetical protein